MMAMAAGAAAEPNPADRVRKPIMARGVVAVAVKAAKMPQPASPTRNTRRRP